MTSSSEIHNRLAPAITRQICTDTQSNPDALVLLESVILGVVMYVGGNPRDAAIYLDALAARVTDRLTEWKGPVA